MGQPLPRLQRIALPALTSIVIALLLAVPGGAHAAGPLPSGGHFVAGTGSMTGTATSLTINQTSSRGVIDWTSFSIGKGNRVNIQNGTGATLNRVTGTNPSSILGSLSATGSVYLINPQGVVIGNRGVVSTGGSFVASTLDIDNTDFMKALPLTFTGSKGDVINLGKISSNRGDVYLIAANNIDNLGSVSAPKGNAEFAVGKSVLLIDVGGLGRNVWIQPGAGTGGTVLNRGAIEAAQINLEAADGNIFALAGNHAVLRATGTATREGHVWLVADTGNVMIDGTIQARDANGGGGIVETNAANVLIAGGAIGKTVVKAGRWNIASPSFTIAGSVAPVFQRSLDDGTSINVQTTGANGVSGDIDVASSIHWAGTASLALGAYHSLTIEAAAKLKNCGSGNLTLRADSTGIDNGGSVVNNGTVDWSHSRGIVSAFYDLNGSYRPGKLLANTSWTSPAYSGLVTQITGYKLVDSLADLEKVNSDLAGNYALGRDIDASATNNGSYVPIGSDNTPFTGQFDGERHLINALTLQGQTEYVFDNRPVVLGLFRTLGASAVVRDLDITGNVLISDSGEWKSGTVGVEGLLAANNYGTIARVGTTGTIENAGWYDLSTAGGIVGVNHGKIERSSSSVDLSGGGTFGGLVGENDGVITQSFAGGSVETTDGVAGSSQSWGVPGGLVGVNNGTISQSYATGAVSINCEYPCSAGALVNINRGTITQSFATGAVLGALETGGIAAENDGVIGSDVYWNKNTTHMTAGVGAGIPVSASNGLTTAQMSNPASFSGWNFGSTGAWEMPADEPFPFLRWQFLGPSGI